jgi:hypothetical protein
MKNYLKTLLFLVCIGMASCSDENDLPGEANNPIEEEIDTSNFSENFGAEISRDFIGRVIDKNSIPIPEVQIMIGSSVTTTDVNGVFIMDGATVFERFGYIKATKQGYIHASRSLAPTNGKNVVTIMMLEETVSGTTTSGQQALIDNGNGASVALSGDYVDSDGNSYEGSVQVILHHLDPTDDAVRQQMPGMLYAQDLENRERALQTLGMLAVELRGDNGEDLNLAENTTAEITIPLDPTLVPNAPETIPLWYFDEDKGYWIEDGIAVLQGNKYVGSVSHFSFWNCDIPAEAYVVCFNIVDDQGNPFANQQVRVTSAIYGGRYGFTNSSGEVCGLLPANETLVFEVFNEDCGNVAIYAENVGPFTEDTTVDIVITLPSNIITETITGVLNDCDSNPLSSGYAVVSYGTNEQVISVTNGVFETTLLRCTNDLNYTIQGFDIDNLQQSDVLTYTFTTPSSNAGNIPVCNDVEEFIEYSIDNGDQTSLIISDINAYFLEVGPNLDIPTLTINGYNESTNDGIYMYGQLNPDPYVGTYDYLDFNDVDDTGFDISEFLGQMENNTIVYNLENLGGVGEYIDISFSGTYDNNSGTHTIVGTVHVFRDL